MVLIIQIITNFYNEFYVHLSCELFIVLDYDEMNYNIVSKVFIMYFEVKIYNYMQ
jgi:hypothetical protein